MDKPWLGDGRRLFGKVLERRISMDAQLKLDVNGQVLYDGQDSTFMEGDISLGAATYADNNSPAEIHFDNLSVKMP
jgi:hypothetical protein